FLIYIISTGHEFSGLTIIWASISLQEHPKILQKLEAYIIPKGWKVMTWFMKRSLSREKSCQARDSNFSSSLT
ncbi:unnamed protein product, partial [Brassica napus]